MGLHLARYHGASVVGLNLSPEQVKIARQRAEKDKLPCEFRIQDYRDVTETFDRIVSVGMFEHVGKAYHEAFFENCHRMLDDDGVMLLHTVGRWDGPSDTNPWVWKYIFPGGYAPALSELAPVIERRNSSLPTSRFFDCIMPTRCAHGAGTSTPIAPKCSRSLPAIRR